MKTIWKKNERKFGACLSVDHFYDRISLSRQDEKAVVFGLYGTNHFFMHKMFFYLF